MNPYDFAPGKMAATVSLSSLTRTIRHGVDSNGSIGSVKRTSGFLSEQITKFAPHDRDQHQQGYEGVW